MARQKMTANDDQAAMFPELDDENPQHNELLRAARAYAKAKAERDAVLSTAKEKVDWLMSGLITKMHQAGVRKFSHCGVTAEIFETREKAIVKIENDGGDNDADE